MISGGTLEMSINTPSPMADTIGLKVVDSNEVRRKQISQSESLSSIIATRYADLGHAVRDTLLSIDTSGRDMHPSSVIPHGSPTPDLDGKIVHSKLLVPGSTFSTPTKFTSFRTLDLYPTSFQPLNSSNRRVHSSPKNPNSKNLDPEIETAVSVVNPNSNQNPWVIKTSNNDTTVNFEFGLHSPTKSSPNSARKLQEVFKQEEERLVGEERIASLVQAIEVEMYKAGTKVDCSELKSQLNLLRAKENIPVGASSSSNAGNSLKIGFHYRSISPLSVSAQSHTDLHHRNQDDSKIQSPTH